MSRSQAHVSLQHQHQTTTLSKPHNTMTTPLPRIRELNKKYFLDGLGAKGSNEPNSPLMHNDGSGVHAPHQHRGHAGIVPSARPPVNQLYSGDKPYCSHHSVTPMETSPWQVHIPKGRSNELYQPQYEEQQPPRNTVQQQQQQQQEQIRHQQYKVQYQPSTAGGMQQESQKTSPSLAKQSPSVQGQQEGAVEWSMSWQTNDCDSPWNPVRPRNLVEVPHVKKSVEGVFVGRQSTDSGNPVSPRKKESCHVGHPPGNEVHHDHGENARQVSARLVCITEHHERSASCPTLHLTPTTPRNTAISYLQNGNHYGSGSFHNHSVTGPHESSPQTPTMLRNGIRKDLEDHSIHVTKQPIEVRNHTNDVVLGWMSSPRSEQKTTTSTSVWDMTSAPSASFAANHYDSQETGLSRKSMSNLTSNVTGTWERVPGDSSSPYEVDVNYYHNNNKHNYPRTEITRASGVGGGTNVTGHGDSNAMDDYESDRQLSQTPRASMASSTTSSETTNTRMSDSGSVTKRRSISAPKREYRCTKKDGCDAVFSCNSLRKKHEMKHTKPFTCLQRSCPKHKVGFTTSNDLRRHMKALHGYRYKPSVSSPSSRGISGVTGGDGSVDRGDTAEAIPPIDAVGGWRCKYCAQMETPSTLGHANPTKGFFSTRKDNFRNHIKRIHSALKRDAETMDEFFRRSEVECRVDSPVLLPTVPSPETSLAMDTDMDSPEASSARGFGERRHGMGEQSGHFGFSAHEDRGHLPSVEVWKGLPPPASSTQAVTHEHPRRDTLPQYTRSTEVSGNGGYHSMGGSRAPDRNETSSQHHRNQQNDHQSRGVGGGYYHQLQQSDRENVESHERRGAEYFSLGRNNNRQVEQFSGPEHPTGLSTRLAPPVASIGWTSVNSSSYNQRTATHLNGPRTVDFATHPHKSSTVRDAGAMAGSEEFSMAHPQMHDVGAEELRRLEQEEEKLLKELQRIRVEKRKLQDQLGQRRLLSSPQPTPARRTHIAVPDQDVEMLDCEPSLRWSAQAEKPISSIAVSARTAVSVSQLLNAEDADGSPSRPIGLTTSPSINTRAPSQMNAVQEESAAHEDLFHPPKSGSPPPPRWQFPASVGMTGSPRGKSTTTASNAARRSNEVASFRRPQSWYSNRMKPVAAHVAGKDNSKEYKAFCPHCQSSFRLPCQLRKHLKRHSKPFGCTHDGCNKVFGAKNDWKRHENSQHHQLECWKCDIRCLTAPPGAAADTLDICGKCFFRKADFVKHLKMIHGNADGWAVPTADQASVTTAGEQIPTTITYTGNRELAQITGDCHIPKFHGGAFWCGFCHKVIKLNGKVGIEGWDKRFDHIACHFEKDNLRVKDAWMRLEEPSSVDHGKAPGVSGAKDVESSDEDEGDVGFHDSSLQRRQTDPTPMPSYARQAQEGMDGAPGAQKESAENERPRWYCCKCHFGPFLTALYVDCPHCANHHKCDDCTLDKITKKTK